MIARPYKAFFTVGHNTDLCDIDIDTEKAVINVCSYSRLIQCKHAYCWHVDVYEKSTWCCFHSGEFNTYADAVEFLKQKSVMQ